MELHHHLIDRLAFINGLVSGIALFPQVWAVFAHGTIAGISLPTYLIIFLNNIVWTLYGMHRGLLSIAIAGVLNFFASAAVIAAVFFLH